MNFNARFFCQLIATHHHCLDILILQELEHLAELFIGKSNLHKLQNINELPLEHRKVALDIDLRNIKGDQLYASVDARCVSDGIISPEGRG